jgi:hypothetical protein
VKIGIAASATLAVLVGAAWLIYWLRPTPPPLLVLVGAPNRTNLAVPHNVPGLLGLKAIQTWADEKSKEQKPVANIRLVEATRDNWDEGLKHIPLKTQVVVVYLAMHGGADAEGPWLLPEKVGPHEPDKFLRIKAVLERLKGLGRSTHKLLILDAAGVPAHWGLGKMSNDFARKLRDLDAEIEQIPQLVVLCSADDGQRSWASEELRQTAFSHYLLEGLKGAPQKGKGAGTLDVAQLYQYVRNQTYAWVWNNRAAVQTPFLLPSDKGVNRARAMKLAPVDGSYQDPDPRQAPGAEFTPPEQLRKNWEQYQESRQSRPAPEAYAPQQWRYYQALLSRYEELVRWGEQSEADQLFQEQIEPAEKALRAGRSPRIERAPTFSLAWPEALGWQAPASWTGEKLLASYRQLKDPPKGAEHEWKSLASGTADKPGDPRNGQLLRARLGRLLLQEGADLPDAPKLVGRLYERDDCPAELNYLALLPRFLNQKRPPVEAIRKALAVRGLAERAALGVGSEKESYPASEQVYRWIETTIPKADLERGLGEDLLFSQEKDWSKALERLQKAEKLYGEALATAGMVREALEVRNQVFAWLPSYTLWAASRRRPAAENTPADVGNLERLWDKAHELDATLRQRKTDGLAGLTKDVRTGYDKVKGEFEARLEELKGLGVQQTPWHEIQAALAVPLSEPGERMSLLESSRAISRKLLVEHTQNTRKVPEQQEADPGIDVRECGLRQARLALAVLGQQEFDRVGPGPEVTFERVRRDLASLAGKGNWQPGLAEAGEQIGQRWTRLAPAINSAVESARTPETPYTKQLEYLEQAERLCRLLSGGETHRLTAELPGPVEELRNACFQGLLVFQAQRALKSEWWGQEQPWYRRAGNAYLADARAVYLPGKNPEFAGLEKDLKRSGQLRVEGLDRLPLTSQQYFDVIYRLKPEAAEWKPSGSPVTWVTLSSPEAALPLYLDATEAEREAQAIGEQPITCKVKNLLQDPDQTPDPSRSQQTAFVHLEGVYRGRKLEGKTRVDLYPLADTIVYRHPVPSVSKVAARADPEIQRGGLSIVIDYSGSMKGQRIKDALNAVEKTLLLIPKGTTVSVRIFGHKTGPRNTKETYEDTLIKPIPDFEKVTWTGQGSQRRDLMDKLRTEKPMNGTPLVEAMVQGLEDLKGADGPKILLVLTDGMDNMYPKRANGTEQPETKADATLIPPYLRKMFRGSDVEINMVFFQLEPDESVQVDASFGEIKNLEPAGTIWKTHKGAELAAALEQALRPKLRIFQKGREVIKGRLLRGGLPISFVTDEERGKRNLVWSPRLEHGLHNLTVYRDSQEVLLPAGECLQLNLRREGRKIVFERALLGDETAYRDRPHKVEGDWRLTVLHNRLYRPLRRPVPALEMTVALEDHKNVVVHRGQLQQIRPAFTWFEVRARESKLVPSLRVSNLAGFSAPCWSVEAPEWVARPGGRGLPTDPDVPVLDAWLSEQLPEVAYRFKRDDVTRTLEEDFRDKNDLVVTVRAERHKVLPAHGQPPVEKQCLVVRVQHPPDQPVMALTPLELPQIEEIGGAEHHFYRAANCYTGVFWPVPEAQAKGKPFSLRFVSLEAFKKAAKARTTHLSPDNMGPPRTNEVPETRPLDED